MCLRRRLAIFGRLQDALARDVPLLPLWERKQIAVVRPGVEGVQATFDAAMRTRFWLVSKARHAVGRAGNRATLTGSTGQEIWPAPAPQVCEP